jgi:CheY-like chemotaxis protein
VLDEVGEAAKVFQRYLDGYAVVRAETPAQALRIVAEQPIHAVLVGSQQDEEVWRELQLTRPRAHRLPLITCLLRTSRLTARELGVVDYIVKPITRERLQSALRSAAGRRPQSVVIADDDPEMVQLLHRMVRSCFRRCQVLTARNGVECLELLKDKRPDVLLLDLLMPGLDGYGVLDQLGADEQLRQLPVVVVTARGDRDENVVASRLGLSRSEGLPIGEAMLCLRSTLDALGPGALGSAREPAASSAG